MWENSLFFQVWKGGITHAAAMTMDFEQRSKYLEIAERIARKAGNTTGSGEVESGE